MPTTDKKSPAETPSFVFRVIVPLLLLVYLAGSVVLALWIALVAWPGSSLASCERARLHNDVKRRVTLESLTTLDRAHALALRWNPADLTGADLAELRAATPLAISLLAPGSAHAGGASSAVSTGANATDAGKQNFIGAVTEARARLAARLETLTPLCDDRNILQIVLGLGGCCEEPATHTHEKTSAATTLPRSPSPSPSATPGPSATSSPTTSGASAPAGPTHSSDGANTASSSPTADASPRTPALPAATGQLVGSEIDRFETLLAEQKKSVGSPLFASHEIARLILLAAMGALGAAIHGISSIAVYIGTRRFLARWSVYYLSRPWIGGALAVTFFVTLSAGLAGNVTTFDATNSWTPAALALLVGLFSGEAMEKLRNVAGAFFQRKDGNDSVFSGLGLVSVTPTRVDRQLTLDADGEGFTPECRIVVNGWTLDTEFVSTSKLKASLSLDDAHFAQTGAAGPLRFNVAVLDNEKTPRTSNALPITLER